MTNNITINYLDWNTPRYSVPVKRRANGMLPGQNDEGYGDKITTDTKVLVNGKLYRVYCTHHANCGSLWVIIDGVRFYLHNA